MASRRTAIGPLPYADNLTTADGLVDADLHSPVPTTEQLRPYLSSHWLEQIRETGFSGATVNAYPPSLPTSAHIGNGSINEADGGAGLTLLRDQALNPWRAEYGILNCSYAADAIPNPDAAAAMAAAVNDWLINEWLNEEPRLRASIVVPSQIPELAVEEIKRVGAQPGFVQVCLPARAPVPYGRRDYHKVFEAAVEYDLVVSLQYGGFPGTPPTGAGWPSYFIEEHVGMAAVMQSQIISLVAEGLFVQFPSLRVGIVEAGFTWLPSLIWRFDKDWKGLRREVPWLSRPPSDYIREHMKFTTQPLDGPTDRPETLREIIDQISGEELLMFSTDYPHWQFDERSQAFPLDLPSTHLDMILGGNARSFYRLPQSAADSKPTTA